MPIIADEEAQVPPSPARKFGVTGGLDYASAYYFRGYRQSNNGLVFQPFATVFANSASGNGWSLRPYATAWGSLSPNDGQDTQSMVDLMGGAVATGHGLTVDARFAYYAPGPVMNSEVFEFDVKASYDLATLWREPSAGLGCSITPYVGIYRELWDRAFGNETYVETGVEPGTRFLVAGRPVGFSVPVFWGLSPGDYYQNAAGGNATLGYFSTGLAVSVGLPTQAGCGRWFVSAAVQYLNLSADNLQTLNDGRRHQFLGKCGVGFAF